MFGQLRNRTWRREKTRQQSTESNSTQASLHSIREFELFHQFCSVEEDTWVRSSVDMRLFDCRWCALYSEEFCMILYMAHNVFNRLDYTRG